jgi:cell division septation protein DedD
MAQMEGEKELVLGNKQLISLFFVVVALCGVFFAMGYMMGRPSGKQLAAIPETTSAAQSAPVPQQSQESEPPRETAPPDTQPPPPTETAGTSTPPATQTQAARDLPNLPAAPAPATAVPETGATYLQVTALRRTDADNLVKTLKEQNFPAILADSSKPDLFRVLVGPYHQTADVADAKARLKALGFANAFVQK